MKKSGYYASADTKKVDFYKRLRCRLKREQQIKALKRLPKRFVQKKVAYWLLPLLSLAIPLSAMISGQYPFSENGFVWTAYWFLFLLSGFILAARADWSNEETIPAMFKAMLVYIGAGIPAFLVQTVLFA